MQILNAKDLGDIIRMVRKKSKLTQAELAASSGVGERFVRELEKGKPSCQLEKSILVAKMLGIKINIQIPKVDEHNS